MKERIAIIDGIRTPFCKAGKAFKGMGADDLGGYVVAEIMARSELTADQIDEVIFGNATMPPDASNVARLCALKGGLPVNIPAYTVQRNCASGMESVTTAANKLLAEEANIILAGSTESMSNIPLMMGPKLTGWFGNMFKARTAMQKIKNILGFRPSMLKPVVGLELGLSDFYCNVNMGQTAEILARDFAVSRKEQDEFALMSHMRAAEATKTGRLSEEIVPIPLAPDYAGYQAIDDGFRPDQTMEALGKLSPYFDKMAGTVTAGNASQVTDGACATILMRESLAKKLGLKPLGYLREYVYAGLEGSRMGLGPVFATDKLLQKTGLELKDFDLIELNEAFASQVIACERAFASKEFCTRQLGRKEAIGKIDRSILNVNGGGIALGHPVGTTGTRLIITLLKELKRRNKNTGLATLCIGGGQGAALLLERE